MPAILTRARAALGAWRQPEVLALATPAPRQRGGVRGSPYRVAAYGGRLTGADYNPEFEYVEKYARYREMLDTDPHIAATRALIDWPYLSARWSLEGGSDEVREWLDGTLFSPSDPQALSWRELLSHVLLHIWYGNYLFERVWYRDPDGLVAAYLSPRPPESIRYWYLDGLRLREVVQWYISDDGRYVESAPIPRDSLVHFVWDQEANAVEGRSILRPLWGEFISKREGRILRNVMIERAGGVLKLKPRQGARIQGLVKNEDDDAIESVRDFVTHENQWLRESDSTEIEFMQTASDGIERTQAVMDYSDRTYMRRILADFMNQGLMPSGSRAVGETQERTFYGALWGYGLAMAGQLQRDWIAPMLRLNFGELAGDDIPTLAFADLEARSTLDELGPLLEAAGRGLVRRTPELERHVLERAGAPQDAIDAVEREAVAPVEPESGTDEDEVSAAAVMPEERYEIAPERADAAQGILARQPAGPEHAVAFDEVARRWAEAETTGQELLESFRQRVLADIMARVERVTRRNVPATVEQLEQVATQKRYVAEYARKLYAVALGELDRGRDDVVEELRRLASTGQTKGARVAIERTRGWQPATTTAEAKAALRPLVERAVADYAARLGRQAAAELAGQATAPTYDLPAVRRALVDLSMAEPQGAVRASVSTGYNSGRQAAAIAEGAAFATYSTLMEDGRSCRPCAARDLDVVRVGSEEYFALKPPFADCESARAASGRNRCRCIYIYSYEKPEES